MRLLETKDVIPLLWAEIQTAGTITAWAKDASIDRSYLSGVLHHQRPFSMKLLRALGLRKGVASFDQLRPLKPREIRQLLAIKVAAAGGQSAWARATGVHRSEINKVMQGKRPASTKKIDALGLREVFVRNAP